MGGESAEHGQPQEQAQEGILCGEAHSPVQEAAH